MHMPTVEAKKRIHRSVRGLGVLAGNRREPSGGEAVPRRTSSGGLETGWNILGAHLLRPSALDSGFKSDGSSTGIPWVRYSQSCISRLRKFMMSATTGWRTNMAVLAIACVAGGCLCSGTCDSETRLTASVYLKDYKSEACSSEQQHGTDAYYIVALITDKMRQESVNLTELLEFSPTQLNFDFMQFFNWSDEDTFVTRSNIVFAPVKRDSSKKNDGTSGEEVDGYKGVILYPDRDPNGMLYIQLVLIKESDTNDWMNEWVSNSTLTGTLRDGRRRLSPFLNDLSVPSGFTATILSKVEHNDIVSWNTFSFFEKNRYGFTKEQWEEITSEKPGRQQQEFCTPVDCRQDGATHTSRNLHLRVVAWKSPLP